MVVLKGVPRVLSPQLLYAMSRMGHGDELSTFCKNVVIVTPGGLFSVY